ncbi:hypothetical protein OO7_02276 [Providencia sneebia DSM 19967]|uniref:Uncharacterized protein n=1 Tax=Providencia sneebia DSM 19967 TaxID=1141660 RepID=K8WXH0_9GAMM|nr:hypothetical protein OO7_02276 [Providencia sneebia DSM 19967]
MIEQKNKYYNEIFLAPGKYFHHEYNIVNYYQLPDTLQQIHNKNLIKQYSLILPDKKTLPLPDCFLKQWSLLPRIVLSLGMLLYSKILPCSHGPAGYLSQYQ